MAHRTYTDISARFVDTLRMLHPGDTLDFELFSYIRAAGTAVTSTREVFQLGFGRNYDADDREQSFSTFLREDDSSGWTYQGALPCARHWTDPPAAESAFTQIPTTFKGFYEERNRLITANIEQVRLGLSNEQLEAKLKENESLPIGTPARQAAFVFANELKQREFGPVAEGVFEKVMANNPALAAQLDPSRMHLSARDARFTRPSIAAAEQRDISSPGW